LHDVPKSLKHAVMVASGSVADSFCCQQYQCRYRCAFSVASRIIVCRAGILKIQPASRQLCLKTLSALCSAQQRTWTN